MSGKGIARGLALMILFSSLFTLKYVLFSVTNWSAYSNLGGQLQALMTLPYWITIIGAVLLVMDKRLGYWLLITGTVLAIVGQGFSYIPLVPWFRWNPLAGLVAMNVTNFGVVALIGYFYLKKARVGTAN